MKSSDPLDPSRPLRSAAGFEAEGTAGETWRQLQSRAAPVLMLRLPSSASVLDAGSGNSGVGLVVADLVREVLISESDGDRLEQLRRLAQAGRLTQVRLRNASPRQTLTQEGPFDVVLLLDGASGMAEAELLQALKPLGQLALQVTGGPGSALNWQRRLLAAGFSSTSLVVPWPSVAAPAAWVDLDSSEAWRTLVSRWLPSGRTPARAALARVWQSLADNAPGALRHMARASAPTFCVLGTR